LGELILDGVEYFLSLGAPLEGCAFDHLGHGGHDNVKISNELPIEGGKSVETSHIMNALWSRPCSNGLNFTLINLDAVARNNVAKKSDLTSEECALLEVTIKLLSLKDLHDLR